MQITDAVQKHRVSKYLGEIQYYPKYKILDQSEFTAPDKINMAAKLEFPFGRVENILGKGENAGTCIFSFSQNIFKSLLPEGCLKLGLCGKELNAQSVQKLVLQTFQCIELNESIKNK